MSRINNRRGWGESLWNTNFKSRQQVNVFQSGRAGFIFFVPVRLKKSETVGARNSCGLIIHAGRKVKAMS